MLYNLIPMKRVFGSHDSILIGQLKFLLEANHIACIHRNEFLQGGAGELPPTECWPEIWVVENDLCERARQLIDAFMEKPSGPQQAWSCPQCEEILEPQFSQCWHCGQQRPAGL